MEVTWLVVSTPLKNIKVCWDDDIWKVIKNVPNHQPVTIWNMWDIALKWVTHHLLGCTSLKAEPPMVEKKPSVFLRDLAHKTGQTPPSFWRCVHCLSSVNQLTSSYHNSNKISCKSHWILMFHSYPLVMTNSSPWKDPPFWIGKPSISIRAIYTMASAMTPMTPEQSAGLGEDAVASVWMAFNIDLCPYGGCSRSQRGFHSFPISHVFFEHQGNI